MDLSILLALLGGLVFLVVGGELLVRGSVRFAEMMGMSPLLIGLTLVGFGTSTPELVTSVQAAMAGSPGIAVGNIVGSNIANVLLILGLSVMIFPIQVQGNALKRDGTLVVGTAALLAAVSALWMLDRVVGLLFIAMLIGYLAYAYRQEVGVPASSDDHTAAFERAQCVEGTVQHMETTGAPAKTENRALQMAIALGTALVGLGIVIVAGGFFVDGAIRLARSWGISETVIGLTIVAVGTSMPEFVTSVIAAIRKQSDVALGNILGSNIYNILGIGGVTALISPTVVPPEIVRFDNFVMLGVSVALFLFMATGRKLSRPEGAALFAGYILYVFVIWPKG
jgi:cation:H+ antiporter